MEPHPIGISLSRPRDVKAILHASAGAASIFLQGGVDLCYVVGLDAPGENLPAARRAPQPGQLEQWQSCMYASLLHMPPASSAFTHHPRSCHARQWELSVQTGCRLVWRLQSNWTIIGRLSVPFTRSGDRSHFGISICSAACNRDAAGSRIQVALDTSTASDPPTGNRFHLRLPSAPSPHANPSWHSQRRSLPAHLGRGGGVADVRGALPLDILDARQEGVEVLAAGGGAGGLACVACRVGTDGAALSAMDSDAGLVWAGWPGIGRG